MRQLFTVPLQLGLIRSLNVHVSGAIAMYEYVQQRLREKCATG